MLWYDMFFFINQQVIQGSIVDLKMHSLFTSVSESDSQKGWAIEMLLILKDIKDQWDRKSGEEGI